MLNFLIGLLAVICAVGIVLSVGFATDQLGFRVFKEDLLTTRYQPYSKPERYWKLGWIALLVLLFVSLFVWAMTMFFSELGQYIRYNVF